MREERLPTYTDNENNDEQRCRKNVSGLTRTINASQNTVGFGAGIALKKAVCVVLTNGLVFALTKADWSVFKKTDDARVFSVTKKNDGGCEKEEILDSNFTWRGHQL